MANICDFTMTVYGKKKNIEKLYKAITQSTNECWIGRGADCKIDWQEDTDEGENCAIIYGWTKWSMGSSLIACAEEMEQQRLDGGIGRWYWGNEIKEVQSFMTLFEFCEKYDLCMEADSEEPGIGFREHLGYDKELGITNECEEFTDEDWEEFNAQFEEKELEEIGE